jgi:hypothetical protein
MITLLKILLGLTVSAVLYLFVCKIEDAKIAAEKELKEKLKMLKRGDIIVFAHPDIPLRGIHAVVVSNDADMIKVFSIAVIIFQHSGEFDKGKISEVTIISKAKESSINLKGLITEANGVGIFEI